MNTIGLKLKKLRKLFGITQEELSKNVDVDRSIISQVEIGKFNLTSENIKKIARYYHIPYDYFFEDDFNLIVENGKVVGGHYIQNNDSLVKENEHLREKLEMYQEKLAIKEEKIAMLEEKLESLGVKRKASG
jgi:transcriptional regulator with XRE-family HTH domain